ncbi:hypothetical protein C2G38_2112714 [Gigaspora rosea]|uniref:Uncharacterized protein n=1 Tax=Gigaspora rosea TaxID=44941 RepID=A0A397UK96_9GLOM|nr:hypothetical protein C2G38_2112714 [Gigaspora rosea]
MKTKTTSMKMLKLNITVVAVVLFSRFIGVSRSFSAVYNSASNYYYRTFNDRYKRNYVCKRNHSSEYDDQCPRRSTS